VASRGWRSWRVATRIGEASAPRAAAHGDGDRNPRAGAHRNTGTGSMASVHPAKPPRRVPKSPCGRGAYSGLGAAKLAQQSGIGRACAARRRPTGTGVDTWRTRASRIACRAAYGRNLRGTPTGHLIRSGGLLIRPGAHGGPRMLRRSGAHGRRVPCRRRRARWQESYRREFHTGHRHGVGLSAPALGAFDRVDGLATVAEVR
jgi:hypothetical protein